MRNNDPCPSTFTFIDETETLDTPIALKLATKLDELCLRAHDEGTVVLFVPVKGARLAGPNDQIIYPPR